MRRTTHLVFAVLLAFMAVGVVLTATPHEAHAQAPDKEFTIAVGETLTFNAKPVERVAVGLSSVVDVKQTSDSEQLILTGKSPGVTTVNFYTPRGQKTLMVRVVGVNPQSLAEEARKVLGEGSGVDVRVVKGRVLLEGEVASKLFKRKIEKLTDLYPNQVLNFTTFREAYVEGARMVALDIYFIQLAVTNRDNLGVQWGQFLGANYSAGFGDVPLYYEDAELDPGVQPGSGGDLLSRPVGLTGGNDLTQYYSVVGNLNVTLDFLVENGLIKTIQQGTVVTEGGKEATYHTGGTLLVRLEGFGSTSLERIPFGLKVQVQPVLDFEDQVKLNISVDQSELDHANGIGEVPALRNTTIDSVVNMQKGESVLITSQNNRKKTKNENGWWMLSKIPILGWLFKSRSFLEQKLDNALFVTPRIYEPGTEKHDTMVKGVFKGLIEAGAEEDDLPELESTNVNKDNL